MLVKDFFMYEAIKCEEIFCKVRHDTKTFPSSINNASKCIVSI